MKKKENPHEVLRQPLNRNRVLLMAVELADEIGITSLSMRKLGEKLGVKAMSLYNHVSNKDDVLDGIVDIVAGQMDIPVTTGPWKDEMRKRANSAHSVLLAHPWATMLIVSRVNVGPSMLRYVNATIGCLVEAGFSYPLADHAWNAIDNHVYGFTLQELNFPFKVEEYANVAKEFLPQIPPKKYPYLHGLSQEVIGQHYDGVHEFEFGLELILDGLARQLVTPPKSKTLKNNPEFDQETKS